MGLKVNEELRLVFPKEKQCKEIFSILEREREKLGEWLPWVYQTHAPEDILENLRERVEEFNNKKSAAFYLEHRDVIVGSIGFVRLNSEKQIGEIGYWLDSQYQGRGFITLAVQTCIEYGFNDLGLNKIIIRCAKENEKSAAVAKRLNFSLEGILKQELILRDQKFDACYYGLLKSEYENV
jgi:ribosomal-protein-serine acetyltransferase